MNNAERIKQKLNFSQLFRKFTQFIYLSIKTSGDNILWESASACSYSFIFSFIPVVLIIFTILVSILKVSPGVLNYVLIFCNEVESIYDFKPLLNSVMELKSISVFNIVLGFWVIWMARKLFMSIVQSMNRIFLSVSNRQTLANQLITFLSEFALVVTFIVLIIAAFVFDKFLQLPLFNFIRESAPTIFRTSSNVLVSSVLYFMFFLFTLFSYKFLSGTKPKLRLSAFYALISTGITFIISFFINKFMDFSRYNVIYGTISTLLVLLFKVYMFFVIFLFCAQMLYVSQLFDDLIVAQMYIMQGNTKTPLDIFVRHKLFGHPSLYNLGPEHLHVLQGDVVYNKDDESGNVFYVLKGSVSEKKGGITYTYQQGDFFGEISNYFNSNRLSTAIADSDTELLCIQADKFVKIIHENQKASAKALERLNQFTSK